MNKIKKDDKVKVIAGKDKGKVSEVLEYYAGKQMVLVKGVNVMKKSIKKSKDNQAGGFEEIEAPINASNLMLFCPKCNTGVKVGILINDKGEKKRICRKCKTVFEN